MRSLMSGQIADGKQMRTYFNHYLSMVIHKNIQEMCNQFSVDNRFQFSGCLLHWSYIPMSVKSQYWNVSSKLICWNLSVILCQLSPSLDMFNNRVDMILVKIYPQMTLEFFAYDIVTPALFLYARVYGQFYDKSIFLTIYNQVSVGFHYINYNHTGNNQKGTDLCAFWVTTAWHNKLASRQQNCLDNFLVTLIITYPSTIICPGTFWQNVISMWNPL